MLVFQRIIVKGSLNFNALKESINFSNWILYSCFTTGIFRLRMRTSQFLWVKIIVYIRWKLSKYYINVWLFLSYYLFAWFLSLLGETKWNWKLKGKEYRRSQKRASVALTPRRFSLPFSIGSIGWKYLGSGVRDTKAKVHGYSGP